MSSSLFKYLFLLFCLFWGVGDFFFFLSFREGLKWISQTKNPAALQWIFGEIDFSLGSHAEVEVARS